MAIGLHQSHKMQSKEIAAYLADMPGIVGNYTATKLTEFARNAIGS
jgi:hypothetical protein